ncbi:MAG: EamA family transporter [Microbacterium sp.]|jgi:drug/metabolite transporter (DMT)-like permease|nr:EamA family transporter [Microbacterium sp.]
MTSAGADRPWLPASAVGISVVLWSTAYGLSAIVLVTASPAVLSVLRVALAVPLMVGLLFARPAPRRAVAGTLAAALRRPITVVLALSGVVLFYLPSNIGLSMSGPGTAALVSASLPVLTALLAWAVIRERMTRRVALGLVLATCGIVLACGGASDVGIGALLLVVGLVSYAVYTVVLRRLGTAAPRRKSSARADDFRPLPDSLALATATAVWGAVLLVPWLAWELLAGVAALPSGGAGWTGILFLALVVTGPTMALYNYGAERVPAAVSATAAAVVPVLGYAFAVVLGEPVVPVKVIGGMLALTGTVVAALPVRDGTPHPDARDDVARVLPPPVSTGPASTHAAAARHPIKEHTDESDRRHPALRTRHRGRPRPPRPGGHRL